MSVDSTGNSMIEKINSYSFVEQSIKKKSESIPSQNNFNDFFQAAMKTLNETSRLEQEVGNLQMDYITGKSDDMLAVVMAEQRAYAALNFTVQVTNKIVDAYKQIIAIQM